MFQGEWDWMNRPSGQDALKNFAGALQSLGARDASYRNDQHMNKVFAANPEFAQMLYGAKNQQSQLALVQEEAERKKRQQEALKALAVQLQGRDLSSPDARRQALLEYGAVSGDIGPALGVGGQAMPAAIQIANEIQRRRDSGDEAGAILLEQSAKLGDKGTYTDLTGQVNVLPGYAPAVATIAGAKADAENMSDQAYDPVTAGMTEEQKLIKQLGLEPQIQAATKTAELGAQKQAEAPKASARIKATLDKSKNVTNTINSAKQKVNSYSAGYGSLLSNWPESQAKDLAADLKTIKGNLGFDELQEMRANSPTGGALGQVSVQEIEFLQSVVANLDQAQSPEQLIKNLDIVAEAKRASDARIQAAFEADYGSGLSGNPGSGARIVVFNPNTNERFQIPAEDLPQAQAEGFRAE